MGNDRERVHPLISKGEISSVEGHKGALTELDALRTRAIVVGIEKHDESAFDRPGVASHACNLTGWLLDCGLRANRIHLFVAPPTFALPPQLVKAGISALAPTQDGFHKFVTRTLRTWNDVSVLLLFWIGHGLLDDDDERRLIFSDATANDLVSLPVRALFNAVRAPDFPQIDNFVAVIDACAQPSAELTQSKLPNGLSFTHERRYGGARRPRFVIFSTAEGERSRHAPPDADPASFAALMCQVLTNTPIPPWPLRGWALFESIRSAVAQAGVKQTVTPAPEGWRFPDDPPLAGRGDATPRALTVMPARVESLAAVLTTLQPYLVADSWIDLAHAFDPCAPTQMSAVEWFAAYCLDPPPARLHRLAEMLPDFVDDRSQPEVLEKLKDVYEWLDREFPRPLGWRETESLKRELSQIRDVALPIFRETVRPFRDDYFQMLQHNRDALDAAVDRLVDHGLTDDGPPMILIALRRVLRRLEDLPKYAESYEQLRKWIERHPRGEAVLEVDTVLPPSRPRISFTIQPVGTDGQMAIDAWLEARREESPPVRLGLGPQTISREQLRGAILDGLREARKHLGPPGQALRLEFFVSLDALDLPLENVAIPIADLEERALGSQYPVVIRSFDRSFRPRELDIDGLLEEKWTLRWDHRPQTDAGIQQADIVNLTDVPDASSVVEGFRLETAAVVGLDGRERPDVLRAALAEGVPIVVWAQAGGAGGLLPSIVGVDLGALPERIRELRAGGNAVRLLYDPPGNSLSAILADGFTQPDESDSTEV